MKAFRRKTAKASEKKRYLPRRMRQAALAVPRSAFELAGVEFIDENGGGPGVRLRKRQPKKG